MAVSHGFTIDCQYSNQNFGNSPSTTYTCTATINVNGDPNTITAVTGAHSQGMTNANVGGFRMQSGYLLKVDKLPSNLATYFPNLIQISWDYARLKTITQADLQPFPNLVYFSAQMNMLRELDGELFKYNPYLQYAYFQYNSIELVGPGFLDGLDHLTDVQFYGNRCTPMSMMMPGPNYLVRDYVNDIQYMCGADDSSSSIDGSCPANCSSTLTVLETEISAVELGFSQGCWHKLMNTLKVWFNL